MAVFTAIGAAVFGAGTLMAGISAAALQIAAGVALNYFAAGLNGNSEQQYAGMQGQMLVGADVARTVPLGLGLADLSPVYGNYWGQDGKTPNAYLTQVFCAGDYPVKALAEIYIDGTLETPLWGQAGVMGAPLAGKRKGGVDHAWVKFYDGTQMVADPWLVSKFGTHPERPYTNRRVGFGCPYIILTTKVHEELWPGGLPQPKVVLSGARLYDISKDSTRGGNGPQRIGIPSTWGGDGDDLTAVQAYALLTGFRVSGQWLYGLQSLPLAQLPDAWWVAQINACRATVAGPDGSEPTYRSGGSLRVSRPISEAMSDLTTSCQGRIVEVGGEYRIHVGALTPPVYHITDGDVLSTEPRRFVPFFGLADTVNGIAATHPSPENGWNTLPLPTLLRPDLEAADGGRRLTADVTLNMVPYTWQAQRIMASALAEARDERKLTIALPGAFYLALPGEFITFTSAANGFVNKLFRIDGVVDRDDGHVLWDLTEFGPDGYVPDFGTYVPPTSGSLLPAVVPPQTIVAWSVIADNVKDQMGVPRRPSVRFGWDPDIEDMRAVGMQLRVAETEELVLDESTDNVKAGTINLASARILPKQDLEGRGRYYSATGSVPQEWTGWLPVRTQDIRMGAADVDIDLSNVAKDVLGQMGVKMRTLIEQFRQQGTLIEEIDRENYTKRESLYREISVELEGLQASFTEIIEVALGPGGAISTKLESLYAALGGNSAEVNVQWKAVAAPEGYSARYVLQAAVNDGTFRAATLFLDVPADPTKPTRIGLMAGETVFFTAEGVPIAMMSAAGIFGSVNGAYQVNMFTGDVTMTRGVIRSDDGLFQISPSLKRISVASS